MKNGIVVGCGDCRVQVINASAGSIMGVDKIYHAPLFGPDGAWISPERVITQQGNVENINVLELKGKEVSAYALIGHTDCAGHSVSDDQHREDIMQAAQNLKTALGTNKPVYAIIAIRGQTDEDWTLELLGSY
jgi:hypothetical protein